MLGVGEDWVIVGGGMEGRVIVEVLVVRDERKVIEMYRPR
jgi:hypothetical protein